MFANFDWIGAMRSSPVMVIILICSVVTLGFALERALYFWKRRGNPDTFFRQASDKVLSEQRLQLERNLGVLGTMGNTAPLIGLLGTVWGIMRAFHDMASTGSAGPSVVAAGVAEALFTTAAALVVAVPSVMLYNQFIRRIAVMLTQAENLARSLRLELEETGPPAEAERRVA